MKEEDDNTVHPVTPSVGGAVISIVLVWIVGSLIGDLRHYLQHAHCNCASDFFVGSTFLASVFPLGWFALPTAFCLTVGASEYDVNPIMALIIFWPLAIWLNVAYLRTRNWKYFAGLAALVIFALASLLELSVYSRTRLHMISANNRLETSSQCSQFQA